MTGVVNGDGTQPATLFGVPLPMTTGAVGSGPQNAPPPDSVETTVTNAIGDWQDQYTAPTNGTTEPGQLQMDFMGLDAGTIADTGAGHGSGSHYPRYPGQQSAGGA
jgi:hypothetical protein